MIAARKAQTSTRDSLLSRLNWLNMAIMCAADRAQRRRLANERALLTRRLERCAA